MACIVSFAIQKGGVGKTTSTVTTAHALAELGKRVLVIDMDPQHNASIVLGKVAPYEQPRTIIDIFREPDMNLSACAVASKYENVDLISSHIDLFLIPNSLAPGSPKMIMGLRSRIDQASQDHYDYILIDCPPNLGGPFVTNALAASDYYIIPLEAESYFALKGVQQFMEMVRDIRDTINPKLKLLGVLITMADMRTNVSRAMVESIKRFFGEDLVFQTIITRSTSINKANMMRKTTLALDSRQLGAQDYVQFAKEMIQWVERKDLTRTN